VVRYPNRPDGNTETHGEVRFGRDRDWGEFGRGTNDLQATQAAWDETSPTGVVFGRDLFSWGRA